MNHLALCNNSVFLFVTRRRDAGPSRREAGRGEEGFQRTPLLALTHPLPLPGLSGARQWDILIFGLLKAALCLICEAGQSYQLTFQCGVFAENRRLNSLPSSHTQAHIHKHVQLRSTRRSIQYFYPIYARATVCTLYQLFIAKCHDKSSFLIHSHKIKVVVTDESVLFSAHCRKPHFGSR